MEVTPHAMRLRKILLNETDRNAHRNSPWITSRWLLRRVPWQALWTSSPMIAPKTLVPLLPVGLPAIFLCRADRLLQQPALPALVGGRYGRDSHDGPTGRADPHGQRP